MDKDLTEVFLETGEVEELRVPLQEAVATVAVAAAVSVVLQVVLRVLVL
jgi:hypothetical protein